MSDKRHNPEIPSEAELLEIFRKRRRPLRFDPLLKILSLPRRMGKSLLESLESLADKGMLVKLPAGAWMDTGNLKSVTGIFKSLPSGDGLVIAEASIKGGGEELFIPARHTKGAWTGDTVRTLLLPHGDNSVVTEIVERATKKVAAIVLKRSGRKLFCQPVKRDMRVNFTVDLENGEDAKTLKPEDIVELSPEREIAPGLWSASLIRIAGKADSPATQELIVKIEHGVPREFPPLALAQASEYPPALSREDLVNREDLRDTPFVTIDGEDARDFDDAIHVGQTGDGWLLRVAIADVSHYVRPDSRRGSLDAEALARGNSWYFPTSVEPMLPEALSNGLCSLRPGEDHLAILAEIPFTKSGEPKKPRFARIVMRSAGRLCYDQAENYFRRIQGQSGVPAVDFGQAVNSMLCEAFELYKVLARKRAERGSLDFDIPEADYKFDANGKLAAIGVAERFDSNRLIEEFMIAANEAVAKELEKSGVPFLYRVHPAPEESKLEELYETLKACAIECLPPDAGGKKDPNPHALLEILDRIKGTPQEYAVNRLCLRAMRQARYQPENIGHFGLASPAYCHFTSPIRRYADLLTHRALKVLMDNGQYSGPDREKLAAIGEDLNQLERRAMECERQMSRRLGCLLMKNHIGGEFKGVISGLTSFGIFVEFANMPIEGMMRLTDLGDDWFEYDERLQRVVGVRSGIALSLGQELVVRLVEVDPERMSLRLVPAKELLPPRPPKNPRLARRGKRKHDVSAEIPKAERQGKREKHGATKSARKEARPRRKSASPKRRSR